MTQRFPFLGSDASGGDGGGPTRRERPAATSSGRGRPRPWARRWAAAQCPGDGHAGARADHGDHGAALLLRLGADQCLVRAAGDRPERARVHRAGLYAAQRQLDLPAAVGGAAGRGGRAVGAHRAHPGHGDAGPGRAGRAVVAGPHGAGRAAAPGRAERAVGAGALPGRPPGGPAEPRGGARAAGLRCLPPRAGAGAPGGDGGRAADAAGGQEDRGGHLRAGDAVLVGGRLRPGPRRPGGGPRRRHHLAPAAT